MALINEHTQGSNVLRNYKKYTDEDRYKIGKYASENGSTATVRKFKSDFPKLKESTVCDFKRKYEEKLNISKKKGENISTLVTEKRRRPPLLDNWTKWYRNISKLHRTVKLLFQDRWLVQLQKPCLSTTLI